jgi:hypothetical protein
MAEISKTCYYHAFQKAHPGKDFKHKDFDQLQFRYKCVTYQNFSAQYDFQKEAKGCFCRKVLAIPAALIYTIKAIYHLVCALFIGIPKALCCKAGTKSLKLHSFYVVRDLQAGLGAIITLFNNRYGFYLNQKSLFHKEMYDYVTKEKPMPSQLIPPEGQPDKAATFEEQLKAIEKAHEPNTEEFNKQMGDLIQKCFAENTVQSHENARKALFKLQASPMKDKYLDQSAQIYIQQHNLNAVYDIAMRCTLKTKEALLVIVAKSYLDKDDLNNALAVAGELSVSEKDKNEILLAIADALYEKGKMLPDENEKYFGESLNVTLLVTKAAAAKKDAQLTKLVEHYLEEPELCDLAFLDKIDKILNEVEKGFKEVYYNRLAEAYFKKEEPYKAFEAACKAIQHEKKALEAGQVKFLLRLAFAFYKDDNQAKVKQVMRELILISIPISPKCFKEKQPEPVETDEPGKEDPFMGEVELQSEEFAKDLQKRMQFATQLVEGCYDDKVKGLLNADKGKIMGVLKQVYDAHAAEYVVE